jgi:pyruvate kinase
VAHERPYHQHLVMLTPNAKTLRQINMIWGVEALLVSQAKTFEELTKEIMETLKAKKLVKKGDKIVMVTGEPLGQKENLNLVEVKTV